MKSKQWENAQYNENSLLFNTYSRSQKQRQHSTRKLKNIKSKPKEPAGEKKKNPSKKTTVLPS